MEQDQNSDGLGREGSRHENSGDHASKEPKIVPFADALIQPLAMVIEDVNAFVANRAMLGALK